MPGPGGLRGRMFAGGYPGDGRWREVSRGVGDAAPLRLARERAAAGACPSSGPAGPPSPKGEGKGCCWREVSRGVGDAAPYGLPGEWAAAGGCGGVGAPRPTDGDMETLWGLRGQSFPGRRAVGAGHARPGSLRRQASMVRSVGRGLDPSAGDYPGNGCWREPPRGVGDAAPTGCPGMGGGGRSRRSGGTPPYGWGYGNAVGFTWAIVSGPPRGRGRACPAREFA